MSIDKSLIQEIHQMNRLVHQNAVQYFHTRPLAVSKTGLILPSKVKHPFEIEYDIKDLLLIGAITHSSVLMTGGTDTGKTTLAKLMMNSLFGKEEEGWHRIDVDTDFGKDTYTDVDFSKMIEGKKLSEGMYQAMGFLHLPGLIWDEINRSHSGLTAKLLHIFDRDISLPDGRRAKTGVSMENGNTYQFQIAAINEGDAYTGTYQLDQALRRRTVLEIPFDIFSLTAYDQLCIKKRGKREIALENDTNHLEKILYIYRSVGKSLPLHPLAEMYASYLESFDYCKHSLTGEKSSIASRNGSINHVCSQPMQLVGETLSGDENQIRCNLIKSLEGMCPYVRGISAGVSKNFLAVARGFALLRATKFVEMLAGFQQGVNEKPLSYGLEQPERFISSLQEYAGTRLTSNDLCRKAVDAYVENLEVELEDINAALGFVGYSKIGMSGIWVSKHYQGNRFEAIRKFSAEAKKKFEEGLAAPELANVSALFEDGLPEQELRKIRGYCETNNPWLWRVIEAYAVDTMISSQPQKDADVETLY